MKIIKTILAIGFAALIFPLCAQKIDYAINSHPNPQNASALNPVPVINVMELYRQNPFNLQYIDPGKAPREIDNESIPAGTETAVTGIPVFQRNNGTAKSNYSVPTPVSGFAARSYDNNWPPDPNGAVNSQYAVSVINSNLIIQYKDGGLAAANNLSNFWQGTGSFSNPFDPRLTYDPDTKRWLLVEDANGTSSSSLLLIAVSQSDDPTGYWNRYIIGIDSTGVNWGDYPSLGFNATWMAVSVNLYNISTSANANGKLFLFDKAAMMQNQTLKDTVIAVDFGTCPAVTYDANEDTLFMMERANSASGTLKLTSISGQVGTEVLNNIGTFATSYSWNYEAPNHANIGLQKNDTALIQCWDDRTRNVVFKNGYIWCCETILLPPVKPNRSSVLWCRVSTNAMANQVGFINDSIDNVSYAFPSLAVNKNNDAVIAFAIFSGQEYAGFGYSYHDNTDPSNATVPVYIRYGDTTYRKVDSEQRNRWGDLTATVTDPINDVDFWTVQEYAEADTNQWGTWWSNIAFVTGIANINSITEPLTIFPNPNTGSFNIGLPAGINTPVEIQVSDMLGRELYSRTFNEAAAGNTIAITSDFMDGLYIVKLNNGSLSSTGKIVIQH